MRSRPWRGRGDYGYTSQLLGTGHAEAKLKERVEAETDRRIALLVFRAIAGWVVYHFHDTSLSADVRRSHALNDNEALGPGAVTRSERLSFLTERFGSSAWPRRFFGLGRRRPCCSTSPNLAFTRMR